MVYKASKDHVTYAIKARLALTPQPHPSPSPTPSPSPSALAVALALSLRLYLQVLRRSILKRKRMGKGSAFDSVLREIRLGLG